jgi:hypothetical protein
MALREGLLVFCLDLLLRIRATSLPRLMDDPSGLRPQLGRIKVCRFRDQSLLSPLQRRVPQHVRGKGLQTVDAGLRLGERQLSAGARVA